MSNQKRNLTTEERVKLGQSVAQGDTGDGNTGVPEFEQGISNRPGDADGADDAQANAGVKKSTGDNGGGDSTDDADATDALKDRQAKGNLGPDKQKGFGQGG